VIVVDTNVLSYLYFPSPFNSAVEALQKYKKDWIAPVLWKSEFLNVASIYYRRKLISLSLISEAFENANEFIITFDIHSDYKEIIELIASSPCSAYDCEFVALAKALNTNLITYDKQILTEFPSIALRPEDYLAQAT
jgi:predicted nucleic acid-binding protein